MAGTPLYRIREVDGQDDDIADTLADLHRLTFFGGASIPAFDGGYWWLAYREAIPVALPVSCHRRMPATPDTSVGSAC